MKYKILGLLFVTFFITDIVMAQSSTNIKMDSLLKQISKNILLLNEYDFTKEQIETQYLGNSPVKDEEIELIQNKLKIQLPLDYINFLKVSNGFHESSNAGLKLEKIADIDYLKVINEDLIDIYKNIDKKEASILEKCILIGGKESEAKLLLYPINKQNFKYIYMVDEIKIEYSSIVEYLNAELESLKSETKGLASPKPKFVIDYSLRNAFFEQDWEKGYSIAKSFLESNTKYFYFQGEAELLTLMLYASNKTNNYDRFLTDLKGINNLNLNSNFINNYTELAINKQIYLDLLQLQLFKNRTPSITLPELEKQIKKSRPDLLKPKNIIDKNDYIIYFLFNYGDYTNFENFYTAHISNCRFYSHLYASIVYASKNDIENSKNAYRKYIEDSGNYRPLECYLNKQLSDKYDAVFLKEMLEILKVKP